MAPPLAKGGTMDPKGGRPAPARKVQPAKKAVNIPLAQVAAPNLVAPPCNHEIYGVKADLWEWVIEFTPDGAVRVVGQDQQGGPGLIVKKITTTTIKERIQGKKDFVVTQSNSIYRLIGKLWLPEMIENGFSQKIMDAFRDGFPKNWASLLQEEWKRQEEVRKSRKPGMQVLVAVSNSRMRQYALYCLCTVCMAVVQFRLAAVAYDRVTHQRTVCCFICSCQ